MRLRDFVPLALLGGLGAFVLVQIARRPESPRIAVPSAGSVARDSPNIVPQGDVPRTFTVEAPSAEPAPQRDDAAIRSQVLAGAPGTYLLALLDQDGRRLMRWPDRRWDALRVWIERDPDIPGWEPGYFAAAGNAFDEWRIAGFPLAFDVVLDSANTNIKIRWVKQLGGAESRRIGVTNRVRDQNGWIVSAEIIISMHDRNGDRLSAALVAGVARHEVGHALGLGHSPDSSDVMYPESVATVISAADRATLHLLYKLPPGIVK